MLSKKRVVLFFLLLIMCITIHGYSLNDNLVEYNYYQKFYIAYSQFLRTCFGVFNFSIGDIIYGIIFCALIWKIIFWFRSYYNRSESQKNLVTRISNILLIGMLLYLIFNLSWGMNYNRKGIATQTQIEMKAYSPEDLNMINELLVDKVNASKWNAIRVSNDSLKPQYLFQEAILTYEKAIDTFPYLKYNKPAVKSSMWGWLGNYLGYTGYYNPFTGEAQVNTTIPPITQPFIVCHEIAHQLGYAKESEANFVAYLVCKQSQNEQFKYAAYLELFFYANRNLFYYDSTSARHYRDNLNNEVKNDIKTIIAFNEAHKNRIEPIITWMYDLFLKGNQQPQGMLSYNQVTAFLINYYRKFGKI